MSLFKKINEGANSLAINAMSVTAAKPQSGKALKAKKILTSVLTAAIMVSMCAVTAFAAEGGGDFAFFETAIGTLRTVVILIGGGVAVWGVINLLEGYGNDNPGAKSQGMKQLMAGVGIALIGITLVPQLSTMFSGTGGGTT